MMWNEKHIRAVVADMTEENPFACRAMFRVSDIVFTDRVPTLAVTLGSKPVLEINMAFLNAHAKNEYHVKAVLMHEFLHVLLQHTEKYQEMTPWLNLALDAIINAIIHRTCGQAYSEFFTLFYQPKGLQSLLMPLGCNRLRDNLYHKINERIYSGKYAADDLHEFLQFLLSQKGVIPLEEIIFLGNHEGGGGPAHAHTRKLLNETVKKLDGSGIWKKAKQPGFGGSTMPEETRVEKHRLGQWKKATRLVLRQCLQADKQGSQQQVQHSVQLPILSQCDRRAYLTAGWTRLIPMASHSQHMPQPHATATVYLDVSGSMSVDLNYLVALLYAYRQSIHWPLWAFSDHVAEARFLNGSLVYNTSLGTRISCVFDHMRQYRKSRCLIITDGYTEQIESPMLAGLEINKIQVIISASGSADEFEAQGIQCHRLPALQRDGSD